MTIAGIALAGYIAIGVAVEIWLYEPERDGIVWRVLLWPLEALARR